MQIGIFAKTFGGTVPSEVFLNAKQAGYRTVQYNMACSGLPSLPGVISDEIAGAVHRASSSTGISIAAVSATYNMIHPDPAVRGNGRQAFKAIAANAQIMGADLLTLCTGSCDAADQWRHHPDNQSPAAWNELLGEFEVLIPIADDHDLYLGVEPELANVVNSAVKARELTDTLASDRIRIVFDAANLFEVESPERRNQTIREAIDLLGDRITMAHAKDRNESGGFVPAGAGVIDYPAYLAALREVGFSGALVAHSLSAAEAPPVAEFLRGVLS